MRMMLKEKTIKMRDKAAAGIVILWEVKSQPLVTIKRSIRFLKRSYRAALISDIKLIC